MLSVAWNATASTNFALPVKIYVKPVASTVTTITAQNWDTAIGGATLVYNGTLNNMPTGWNTVTLQTPFYYNGSDNMMVYVETSYGGYGTGTTAGNAFTYSTAASKHMYIRGDNTPPTQDGTVGPERPNIRMTFGPAPACPPPE